MSEVLDAVAGRRREWIDAVSSSIIEKGGDTPQVHGGDYFVLWRLDADGAWRIERYADVSGG